MAAPDGGLLYSTDNVCRRIEMRSAVVDAGVFLEGDGHRRFTAKHRHCLNNARRCFRNFLGPNRCLNKGEGGVLMVGTPFRVHCCAVPWMPR